MDFRDWGYGFLGLRFLIDVVWGHLGFLGWGSLYKNRRIIKGKEKKCV